MIDSEPPQATKNTCFTDLASRAESAATNARRQRRRGGTCRTFLYDVIIRNCNFAEVSSGP